MEQFPKKYTPKELNVRAKNYRKNINNKTSKNTIFSPNELSSSKKLCYNDFFLLYIKDFFEHLETCKKNSTEENGDSSYEQLFITSGDQIKNIGSCYNFFKKKGQNLLQVGNNKIEKHIISSSKKTLNANNKIIESYFSSQHKIYIPDSELYIYILNKFRELRQKGKMKSKTEIGYRSFNLQTSIPTEYIIRKEEKKSYHVLKYFVGAKCEALPVYVEDIDLCCGDVALLVHPKDKRYNKYIGKNAIIPLCNRQIPIIGDENVNIALNNGIQRVCPCADQESIELANKYGLPTNIYVFDQQGLYTEFIREHAFIGQERSKYYHNIEGFIEDIGNSAEKGTKMVKIPYLNLTNEQLTPYKINKFIIDLTEEKSVILNKIFKHNINFNYLDSEFKETFNEITSYEKQIKELSEDNDKSYLANKDSEEGKELIENLNKNITQLKQRITNEINKDLPDSLVINSQLGFGWRMPFINNNGNTIFFDIEKDCFNQKSETIQNCFDFIILSLIRIGTLCTKKSGNPKETSKPYELNKFFLILSENEKKIQYFIKEFSEKTGKKNEHEKLIHIIQNLFDENNPTIKECTQLINNSKYIERTGDLLLLKLEGLCNDTIDPNFIQLCIPCYLTEKNIKINNQIIFNKKDRNKTFKELLIQESFLGKTISNTFSEYSYNQNNEFLGNKQLTKLQREQSQRNLFSLYGENPIRLTLLIHQTYNEKEILLNNIFLKQIWNANRFCSKKGFLPKDIQETLNTQPKEFDDFDLGILYKLNELYTYRIDIKTYEEYIHFFNQYKTSIQDIFFSRYLEIQKVNPTKNVQFVCSYFFNFLLTVLYPLVPEYVDAIQYISKKKFLFPINFIKLDKGIDYNMNILYNTFINIKHIKIENNIQQHETCNIFIKSNPTICEIFTKYEQIFKNYFHISEISYLRLHEQSPLGYETFSNDTLTIGIQSGNSTSNKEKDSLESIEKDIKNLDDKLNLIKQRLLILPEGEQRTKAEEEYAKTKEEIENLTIKHSLLNSK